MRPKILVVEDDRAVRENTVELFELFGCTAFYACNGREGLELALRHHPDLVVSDIKMPVMDGYHLLEKIRTAQALTNTKFIFLSAAAEEKDIKKGLGMGADDYITKPFSCEKLLQKAKTLLYEPTTD